MCPNLCRAMAHGLFFQKESIVRLIRNVLAATALLTSGFMAVPAWAGFLQFPLHCSDTACTINYAAHGAYTADAMNSVLDH